MRPIIEEHDLAAVITEPERLAVEVFANDIRRFLADP